MAGLLASTKQRLPSSLHTPRLSPPPRRGGCRLLGRINPLRPRPSAGYFAAASQIIEAGGGGLAGIWGLIGRGLLTKIISNGISAMLFRSVQHGRFPTPLPTTPNRRPANAVGHEG